MHLLRPAAPRTEQVGLARHEEGVRRLLASYRALPPDRPVRLAKSTSNLFRPREAVSDGLDVSGLTGVIAIDPAARTADVQGMCTYETLVAATLRHGLMPLVVPQLRTITLGGAVTGLGIESTSFRNGLPHESVLELDILTGSGDLVTARPDGPCADLYHGFPNSYGSLGYATRLRIELQPIGAQVRLRNVRFTDLDALAATIAQVATDRTYDGEQVDAMDGVVFEADEAYLMLAQFTDVAGRCSDYAGQDIYWRSIQQLDVDRLTGHDYLWRWDTDWFWCSEAFGAQQPLIRRIWPRAYRRSDVYHRIVKFENRHHIIARINAAKGRPEERLVQDVEVDVARMPEFVRWLLDVSPLRPLWLCPLRLREAAGSGSARSWPLYPMEGGRTYVNLGFWGQIPIAPGAADGDVNRAIERRLTELGGHKSLYSDVYYSREEFAQRYGGAAYDALKARYDPGHRLDDLYDKAVGSCR